MTSSLMTGGTKEGKGRFHDLLELRVGKGIANGTLTLFFEDVPEEEMDSVIRDYKAFRKTMLPVFGKPEVTALPKHVYKDLSEYIPSEPPAHPHQSIKTRKSGIPKSDPESQGDLETAPITKRGNHKLVPVDRALDGAGIVEGIPNGGEIVEGCLVQQITRFPNGEKFFGKIKVEKVDNTSGDILVVVRNDNGTVRKIWKPKKYFGVVR